MHTLICECELPFVPHLNPKSTRMEGRNSWVTEYVVDLCIQDPVKTRKEPATNLVALCDPLKFKIKQD